VSLIEVGPGQVEVAVGGSGALAPRVRLFDWARADEYESAFTVEAVADGMRAQLETVTVTVWDDMSAFFDGLARDFRWSRVSGLGTPARSLLRGLDVHGDDHDRGRGRNDGSR
jgi:hypothetical protein